MPSDLLENISNYKQKKLYDIAEMVTWPTGWPNYQSGFGLFDVLKSFSDGPRAQFQMKHNPKKTAAMAK